MIPHGSACCAEEKGPIVARLCQSLAVCEAALWGANPIGFDQQYARFVGSAIEPFRDELERIMKRPGKLVSIVDLILKILLGDSFCLGL